MFVSTLAVLVAALVGSSRGFLSRFDEPVLDVVSDAAWLGALSRIDLVGSTPFAIVVGTTSDDERMRRFCRYRAEKARERTTTP